MAEKILNTRIQLKYDSHENWVKANTLLKAGEVAIAYLPPRGEEDRLPTAQASAVLMKVGPGNFNDLPYVSALAADVHSWAKCSTVELDGTTLKFHNGDKTKPVHTIDFSKFALDTDIDGLNQTIGDLNELATGTTESIVGAINEHESQIGELGLLTTKDKENLVKAINEVYGVANAGGSGSVVTVTKQATPTDGSEATYVVNQGGKAVDVKIEIPKFDAHGAAAQALKDAKEYADANDANTWRPLYVNGTQAKTENISSAELHIDNGEVTTAAFDDGGQILTINHNQVGPTNGYSGSQSILGGVVNAAGDSLTIKVPVLNVDNYGHTNSVDEVEYVVSIPKAVEDTNTAHTHKVGYGLTQEGNDGISGGEVLTKLHLAFVDDSDNKLLKLVDATDTTQVIASFDTTKFIADGMLASVTPDVANNKLVFEWNTTAGITKTEIELDKIADIYTAAAGAGEVQVAISNENVVSATLVKVPESKLEEKTQTALGLARTALQLQDINGKADKKVPTAAGNFAALDATGNLIDSGKKVADFATKAQGDNADSAVQSVKVLGQTLTKNSNEITVAQAKTALGLDVLASKAKIDSEDLIGEDVITGTHINAKAIATGHLDDSAVTTAKIANQNVTYDKLATAVTAKLDKEWLEKDGSNAADNFALQSSGLTLGNGNSCEVRFGENRALEIDAEEINFVASETDSDPVLKVNSKALSTDHIAAGTEVWIFNCGDANNQPLT